MSEFYKSKLFLSFSFFIFSFSFTYGQGVNVSGKLHVNPKEKSKQLWFASILVKADGQMIGTGTMDSACRYMVKINEMKNSSLKADVFITMVGIDTSFIKSVFLLKNSNVNCDLDFPNIHDKNVLGDVTCPKCGKTDKTIPIVYEAFVGIRENKYGAGTDTSGEFSPAWYCKRCNIKF